MQRENYVALQPPRQCSLVLLAEVVCVLDKAAESEEDEGMGGGLCWYAVEERGLLVSYVFRLSFVFPYEDILVISSKLANNVLHDLFITK